MPKKLIDYLVELELYTEDLTRSKKKIESLLDDLLAAPDKSFEVSFCEELFNFDFPFTNEERIESSIKRKQLIDRLMAEAFISGNWDYVLVFASGVDPLEMQCEIIKPEDIYNITDNDGNIIKSLPLDENAHVVKTQRLKDEDAGVAEIEELV